MTLVLAHILGMPVEELFTPVTLATLALLISLVPRKRRFH